MPKLDSNSNPYLLNLTNEPSKGGGGEGGRRLRGCGRHGAASGGQRRPRGRAQPLPAQVTSGHSKCELVTPNIIWSHLVPPPLQSAARLPDGERRRGRPGGHERAPLLHLPVVPERRRPGQDAQAEKEDAAEATAGTLFSAVVRFTLMT